MKIIITFTLILQTLFALSQDTIKACYFQSLKEYTTHNSRKVGPVIYHNNTEVSFYYQYTNLNLNSKKIWGFIDNEGREYRSIDYTFYEIIDKGAIIIYKTIIDGIDCYKISEGFNMYPIDLNEDNIRLLISSNNNLLAKYNSLSKKDRKIKSLEYINLFNIEYYSSIIKN